MAIAMNETSNTVVDGKCLLSSFKILKKQFRLLSFTEFKTFSYYIIHPEYL